MNQKLRLSSGAMWGCALMALAGSGARTDARTRDTLPMENRSAEARRNADPPPSRLKELWVLPHNGTPPAELVMAQALQGLTGRKKPTIWLRAGSMSRVIEEQLRREVVRFHEVSSAVDLLRRFKPSVKGLVLYRLNTPSLNVATSLAGVLDAVPVDESLLEAATAEGLKVVADVRDMTEREAFERYRDRFGKGIVVEQSPEKPGHLRDFAVMHRAFTYYTPDTDFRTQVAKAFGPLALAYGWGDDEYRFVQGISQANASVAPSDWCVNLSAMSKLSAGKLRRPKRALPEIEEGVRYLAFVMSDGDNLQWLTGNFVDHRYYWGSPLRGRFPMTWEVSPLLSRDGPRVLQHIYATATATDGFVTGPGVPGYTFPHYQTDRAALARQASPYLKGSDLSIVSVLNANDGDIRDTIPILERPEVDGVLYKDYSPYHRSGGRILWHKGKPAVSYRFLLWDQLMKPEDLQKAVAAMPTDSMRDEMSFALVNVHAWSFGDIGGPMEAIRRSIERLPPNTRVITAGQLIGMLRRQFGEKHKRDRRVGQPIS